MSARRLTSVRRELESLDLRTWLDAPRRGYASAAIAVVVVTLAMLAVRGALGVLNALLVFLLLCFLLALTIGGGPAVLAALMGFVALDFFFIPPYYRLAVARGDHVLALFVYLGIAVVTGQLVARVRARTEIAEREQRRTALLYELNAALIGDITLDAVLATIVEQVVHVYGAQRCRILLPGADESLAVQARFPLNAPAEIDRQGAAVAEWAMTHRAPAGLGASRERIRTPHGIRAGGGIPMKPRPVDVLYVPIATSQRVVGVLEVQGRPGSGRFHAEDEALLASFANQAALALERGRLAEEASTAAALAQSDELKSVLLAAVSHDLRTPLAVIKTSVTSLLDPVIAWGAEDQTEFLNAIDEETDRLTSVVQSLLDLSRIEGGVLRPNKEWYDVAEAIEDVAERLRPRAMQSGHRLETWCEPDLPIVAFDYVEIAQVLTNLGENALKHTPAGTTVTLSARRAREAIELSVEDNGPGIPVRELTRIFEKFHRVNPNSRVPGSGIGLAICKGLVAAHGGVIWAESRVDGGASFRFTLPLPGDSAPGEPS